MRDLNRTLAQLGAVIRYEFLILWRQRIIAVGIVGVIAVMLFVLIQNSQFKNPANEQLYSEADFFQVSTAMLLSDGFVLHVFVLLFFPILVADTDPKDRQYRVRELLQTLPLLNEVYVAGKVLAVCLNMLICVTVSLTVVGIVWRILFYPFDVGVYLTMAFLGVLPVALVTPALSVLIAATQPTRRRAILVGIGVGITCITLMGFGITGSVALSDYLNPGRPIPLRYYMGYMAGEDAMRRMGVGIVTPGELALAGAFGLAEVALIGAGVTQMLRRETER